MNHFIRLACVPENGLLDIESRYLHDSVSDKPGATLQAGSGLTRAGFHRPSQFKFSCDLEGVQYVIESAQAAKTQYSCGAVPEITLTVTRDGQPLLSEVAFGKSCSGRPSIMRLTIGDGKHSWRGRETEVCYRVDETDTRHCEWLTGPSSFATRFPIYGGDVERIVARFKKQ